LSTAAAPLTARLPRCWVLRRACEQVDAVARGQDDTGVGFVQPAVAQDRDREAPWGQVIVPSAFPEAVEPSSMATSRT
jgi:hypothetical protein